MDSDKTENETQPTLAVVVDRTVAALSKFVEERGDALMTLEDSPKQSGVEIGLIAQAGKLSAKIVYAEDVGAALLIEVECTVLMSRCAPTAKLDGEMCSLEGIVKRELALLHAFKEVTHDKKKRALIWGEEETAKQASRSLEEIESLQERLRNCNDKIRAGYLAELSQYLRFANAANKPSHTLSDDDKAQVLPNGPHGDEDFADDEELEDNPDDFNGGDEACDTYPMIGTKARYLTADKGDVTAHVGIVKAVMVSPTDGRLLVQLVNKAGDIHNADGFTVNYDEQDYDLFCDVMGKVEAISVEGNELVRKTIEKYNEKVGKQFERLGSAVAVDTFETKH